MGTLKASRQQERIGQPEAMMLLPIVAARFGRWTGFLEDKLTAVSTWR